MTAAKIIAIIIVTFALIGFVRGGETFHIAKALPFCSGGRPGLYDFTAGGLIAVMFWGIGRLGRIGTGDDETPEEEEEPEPEDGGKDDQNYP